MTTARSSTFPEKNFTPANFVSGRVMVDHCRDQAAPGATAAQNELLAGASARLVRLAHRLKRDFPGVGRWEQTDDILQNALLRLYQAIQTVKIQSPLHFYRLAALQIRRELLDLCRHYQGTYGAGTHHSSWVPDDSHGHANNGPDASETTSDPHNLAEWADFHRIVELLSAEDREMFDLLWYAGMSQTETASTLNLSTKTVQRRWRAARLNLSIALDGQSRH